MCEAIALQQRLQPLGITLHALPDASVDAAAVHLTGNLDRVPPNVPLYFSADGYRSNAAISAEFVFRHPATGVLQRGSCAVATCGAASEDAEWLAVVLAVRQVEGRPNPLVRVGDAAGTSFAGWTRGPPDHSLWALAFRSLVPWLSTISVDEFWTPAQHRGLASGPIRSLNAWAHEMASGSLRLAAPWTVPPCAGLTHCVVLMHRGVLMLQLPAALDAAYKEEVDRRFWQRFGPATGPWSGTALEQMFLAGSVSSRQALQATRNRLYTWAARPPDFGAALCPLCGLAFADATPRGLGVHPPAHVPAAADLGGLARFSSRRPCSRPARLFGCVRGHNSGLQRPPGFRPCCAAAPHSPTPGGLDAPPVDSVYILSGASLHRRLCLPPPSSTTAAFSPQWRLLPQQRLPLLTLYKRICLTPSLASPWLGYQLHQCPLRCTSWGCLRR